MRWFQDVTFDAVDLRGRAIERIGYLRIGPEPDTHMLYVKLAGGTWHRGFLDAWFAVWEDTEETDALPSEVDEPDDIVYIDVSEKFTNRTIRSVRAYGEPERMPSIEIGLEDGAKLELRVSDDQDPDSPTLVVSSTADASARSNIGLVRS